MNNRSLNTSLFFVALIGASLNTSAATFDITGIFTQYAPDNSIVTSSSAIGIYDDVSGVMNLSGSAEIIGAWSADGDIVTVPGTYSMDTGISGLITGIEVGTDQWFGPLFFDWGASTNIDGALVWNVTVNPDSSISLLSTDVISDLFPTGSGVPGHPSISGPTLGFAYSVDLLLTPTAVPVPAAFWLFGSGLLGLLGASRRKKLNSLIDDSFGSRSP